MLPEPSEMDLLRQSADLLSYKLGIEQGTGACPPLRSPHLAALHLELLNGLMLCRSRAPGLLAPSADFTEHVQQQCSVGLLPRCGSI